MLRIVPYYAAGLALLYVYLAFQVIKARRAAKISVGMGGDPAIERAARVHGNFGEYTPFALLLLSMAELRGAAWWALHALCLAFCAGRIAHAWGMSRTPEQFKYRVTGMQLTFGVLGLTALLILAT